MLGILQEQHPDRARLFMQWKQMDWPLLADPLNLLGVPYVPITLAIDEHGIIRDVDMPLKNASQLKRTFLNKTYPKPETPTTPRTQKPDLAHLGAAASPDRPETLLAYADAVALWGGPGQLQTAIEAYEQAITLEPDHAVAQFRLGVVYRMRYDSDSREPGDFQKAVDHWTKSLDIDPNNYITRRRLQQFGPRLDKPYPFYDWVVEAQQEIRARGEDPIDLTVQPGGAEFAHPAKTFEVAAEGTEPDPEGKIARDQRGFVRLETTVVPHRLRPGEASRVHLVLRPTEAIKAHWNNEVGPLVVWVTPPEGWSTDRRNLTVPNPPEAVSREPRKVEFELRAPEAATAGQYPIPAYTLYYVCEDVHGVCLYRRQDFTVRVEVEPSNHKSDHSDGG